MVGSQGTAGGARIQIAWGRILPTQIEVTCPSEFGTLDARTMDNCDGTSCSRSEDRNHGQVFARPSLGIAQSRRDRGDEKQEKGKQVSICTQYKCCATGSIKSLAKVKIEVEIKFQIENTQMKSQ